MKEKNGEEEASPSLHSRLHPSLHPGHAYDVVASNQIYESIYAGL